ncbi:MAG: acetyl ornithine aminotransferase family protein [Chloroflexi bacterium]|nr:acetyl ornithine aminotransferase family protein [Chloroflexota bacterium]
MAEKTKIAQKATEIPGPKAQKYVERDRESISPSYTRSYPFVMDHGQGSVVWDVDGNRYIDFNAGIAVTATGHSHPKVVEAIKEQAEKFIHMSGTDFYYPVQIELAEKLNSLAPGDEPKQVFFTNSGTEAIEAAFKLARYYTGRPQMLAFLGGFHGRSLGALSLTASKAVQRKGFFPLVPGVTHVPYGYCYRCPYQLTYPSCDVYCVEVIETGLFKQSIPPDEVAAIFVEPVQGEGGYVIPPPMWMPRLRELADRHGILLVVDEIQTGMGRTGKWFASEHFGVVPDIVAIAKGIASGMPLGAMIARRDLMTWPPGAHGNTFGGNPISSAAALATISVIEEEGLLGNAATMGQYMLDACSEMMERHSTIGDVRGLGLMVGVELIRDKKTKEPAAGLRDQVVERAFKKGLLILGTGPSTVRFMPALNIDRETVDEGLTLFEEALSEVEQDRPKG